MSFLQFAFNNVRRNARAYIAYFLSSAFMVMIFFTYAMFIFHPGITGSEMGRMTRVGMQAAEYIIFIFSFLFVLYSISSFLKARSKEFGILTILGATTGTINRLIFLENMMIGLLSILAGLASGMLLSKLFLLLGAAVTGGKGLPFYLPWRAMIFTTVAFMLLFLFLSVFTLLFIRKNRVLELLTGSSKPKKEPKTSWVLVLLGIVLLAVAVMLLRRGAKIGEKEVLLAAAAGIGGTYFFYTQVVVFLLKAAKRSKRMLWRGTNLIWVSEMAYKLKDNARMLFMVTIATSLACMSVGMILSVNAQIAKLYAGDPFAMTISVYNESDLEKDLKWVEGELEKEGIAYETFRTETIQSYISSDRLYVELASLTNYNKLAERAGATPLQEVPQDQGVLLYSVEDPPEDLLGHQGKAFSLESPLSHTFTIMEERPERLFGAGGGKSLIVVNDADYDKIKHRIPEDQIRWISSEVRFLIKAWDRQGEPSLQDQEVVTTVRFVAENRGRLDDGETENYLSARGDMYANTKQGLSMFSFVGVFIAAIFSISSASFLYFKLYSELNQDRRMYHSLSKIGLADGEMKFASGLQIALLFFVPILISGIQTMVVLSLLGSAFNLGQVTLPVLTATGAFLAVQALYYAVVRSRYMVQLKRVMV
ncbi:MULTISPECIES: ABC transporter permease [Paenibacillus]|uniref:ABC transporter permease n=1 Tax=Paenibacillus TaxID=44249 RepID=UPI002FDF1049